MTQFRNLDTEALNLRDLIASDEGFRNLTVKSALEAINRFQECFPRHHGVWSICYDIKETIEKTKYTITRPVLHELMCPLLTDEVILNKAERIRSVWTKTNKKEIDLPVDPVARVREQLKSRDLNQKIAVRGFIPRGLHRQVQKINKAVDVKEKRFFDSIFRPQRGGFRGRSRGGYSQRNYNNRPQPRQNYSYGSRQRGSFRGRGRARGRGRGNFQGGSRPSSQNSNNGRNLKDWAEKAIQNYILNVQGASQF